MNCEPVYLTVVIKFIGLAAKTDHSMTDAVLVVEAMAIHKDTFWDPKNQQYVGNVNYGTAVPEACEKRQMTDPVIEISDQNAILAEHMLLLNDINNPHPLKDNILYYIAGHIVQSLLAKVSCETCRGELLLDPTDAHASQLSVGPLCARFTAFKQRGGLVFPSTAVFNVVRVTESVFHRHVVGAGTGVPNEKISDLKIQNIVFEQMGTKVFSTNPAHFFDHKLREERHHTSSVVSSMSTCQMPS